MGVGLELVAPDLVEVFRSTDGPGLRAVALEISKWITTTTGVVDDRLESGLAALRGQRFGPSNERDALQTLIYELDELAWSIQDQIEIGQATEQQYVDAFCRARTANAAWSALASDALEAAIESAYEAQAAAGDLTDVRRIIMNRTR